MSRLDSLRCSTFHLPGDGKPAPSAKILVRPFRCGRIGGPLPHQPSPSFGRFKPGISGSSSVVTSSMLPTPAADCSTSSSDKCGSISMSGPSRIGRSAPFLSRAAVASSIAA